MLTEQANPNSENIDQLDTLSLVRIINAEDMTVAQAVQAALPAIAAAVDAITAALQAGGRLLYIGAGTSGRLGILDAVECVPTYGTAPQVVQGIIAGGERAMMRSVEGAEDSATGGADDLKALQLAASDIVCGIAASGRTPYVIGALEYARSIGAKTIGLSCNVPAPVLEAADIAIGVATGSEVISGSTRMKAGTAQKMVLNMLSTGSMVKLGKVYGNLMVDVQVTNQKLAARARRLVMVITGVDETQAMHLLQRADNSVKVAVVMQKRNVDAATARQLLVAVGGHLRRVIG